MGQNAAFGAAHICVGVGELLTQYTAVPLQRQRHFGQKLGKISTVGPVNLPLRAVHFREWLRRFWLRGVCLGKSHELLLGETVFLQILWVDRGMIRTSQSPRRMINLLWVEEADTVFTVLNRALAERSRAGQVHPFPTALLTALVEGSDATLAQVADMSLGFEPGFQLGQVLDLVLLLGAHVIHSLPLCAADVNPLSFLRWLQRIDLDERALSTGAKLADDGMASKFDRRTTSFPGS
mmetsp:Transcript_9137/g.21213  ORF Transcript_9137/g.21213 Transcript_9137/m.21213 type:complete len:237 (+) Transcript_9137:1382-2092(+)